MASNNDDDNTFEKWSIPDFEQDVSIDGNNTDLFGRPASWYQDTPAEENETKEEGPKPLTLEDIEAIRASAYEDGFNEGKEAGYNKGLEEGKLQGLGEGHEEGLAQGLQEGLTEGQVKVDVQTLHWQQLVSRLHRPLEKLDEHVEFQLITLATNLAEQMVRCEVTVNPQVVLQALKQGIEALPVNEQHIIISLNPEDLSFVQDAFSEKECEKRGWDLRSEPTLLRGDCQIQTQTSSIDYAFSTRITQVLKHFLKENYQNTPEVSNDGELSNDHPIDYEMQTEDMLNKAAEPFEENEKDESHVDSEEPSVEVKAEATEDLSGDPQQNNKATMVADE